MDFGCVPAVAFPNMVFHAILWITQSGAAWRDLPERYGSWKTVYSRFCKWRDDGTLQTIFHVLNKDADYENLSLDSCCGMVCLSRTLSLHQI